MADSENQFELSTFAREIEAAFDECRPPRLELGKIANWWPAIHELLRNGKLDTGAYGLSHVRKRFPGVQFVERMSAIFSRLPPAGTQLSFDDDLTKEVQVVARPGADTVVLLFCGGSPYHLGLPVALEHRWHGNLNASLIYLRDFQRCSYLRGLTSIGTSREATLAELRRIIASIGARRIVCYGTSAGMFGALNYGLELEAEAVLGMSGATNLTTKFAASSPWEKYGKYAERPNAALDMRPLYASADRPPRVKLVYGQDNWDDRIQAEHMRGLSCVQLYPLEFCGEHNSIIEAILRGQFEDLLHWLVSPAATDRGTVTKTPRAAWSNLFRRVGLRLSRRAVRSVRSSSLSSKAAQRVRSSHLLIKAVQRVSSSRPVDKSHAVGPFVAFVEKS